MQIKVSARVRAQIEEQSARLQQTIDALGCDAQLQRLIEVRTAQLDRCGFCLDRHGRRARELGESEERIAQLASWRESSAFDPRERAVLGWADALAQRAYRTQVLVLRAGLDEHFSAEQIYALTSLIAIVLYWNRSEIGVGHIHPVQRARAGQR